jgi:hypothetical protein
VDLHKPVSANDFARGCAACGQWRDERGDDGDALTVEQLGHGGGTAHVFCAVDI